MSETKTFGIGAVLSAVSGTLVCELDDLYGIFNHLTGESLMTHQLPRAMDEASDTLRERFPDLAAVEFPDWSDVPREDKRDVILAWVAGLAETYGATREVAPLATDEHTYINPIAELKMMRPDAPILVVDEDGVRDA